MAIIQGDCDAALEWLVPAIETITRENDAAYVSQRATTIADIYVKKDSLQQAKRYIDMALDFHERSRLPEKESDLYFLLDRYYRDIGDKATANAFHDSARIAIRREEDSFSGLVLRRVEQRLRAAERTIHEQQLNGEKTQSRIWLRTAVSVSASLAVILVMFCITLVNARRKHDAYRALVIKSRQWALMPYMPPHFNGEDVPGETDKNSPDEALKQPSNAVRPEGDDHRKLFEHLKQLVEERKLYLDPDASLDHAATLMAVNRNSLSNAVNRCTRDNFSVFLNEFRLKEAIRLMSDKQFQNRPLERIYGKAGFNSRMTFFRVFKKATGVTPTYYRKNIQRIDNP